MKLMNTASIYIKGKKQTPMMQCGHAANATSQGLPVCAICVGINPGARLIDPNPSSLEGRQAKCFDCGTLKESASNLPFFESRPDRETDAYYCGCRGWN